MLRIGTWIEKHWPEKLAAEAILAEVKEITSSINQIIGRLEVLESHSDMLVLQDHLDRIKKLEEAVKTIQTQATFKSRVVGSVPDTMTPFAQRLQPVQPANNQIGGIRSPQ